MNAIEVKGLSKSYGDFHLDVSFTLPSGCIMGLVGENGAGKSTTIKLLLNMAERDGGEVRLLGRDSGKDARPLKEEIGVVLDEVGFPECLTANQLGKVMKNVFKSWDGAAYLAYLKKLDLPDNVGCCL